MAQAAGYTFNSDTVTSTRIRDLAGYFLHGTILGSAEIVTGKYDDGLNCTGGAMRVANIDEFSYPLNADGGLSIAAWVKLNTTTAAARCVASAATGTTLRWALYASNASGNVEVVVNGATYSTSTSIRDSAWHHVMFVLDATLATDTFKIFVDGTQVHSVNAGSVLAYSANATMEVGRNAVTGAQALDGIVDDLRWWNDPVETSYIPTVIAAEQIDFAVATYAFDADDGRDSSSYTGRDLTIAGSASFTYGMYGRALVSGTTAAGASGTVNFGDVDRLAVTGWIRLDTAPVGSPAPILTLTSTGGTAQMAAVVNTDRTITATWNTLDGSVAVTSTTALTLANWTRVHISINPTYVGIRVDNGTQIITSYGDGVPHLAPTINDLDVLYVGGNATTGGAVSWDYLNFTRNFLAAVENDYWTGPVTHDPYLPANISRGVYHMNEGTGSTVNDSSGVSNNLTLTGAGSWVTGIQGTALGANGTGPGASNAAISWPASPKGWAFSAWVKCRTSPSGARFLVLRNASSEVAHVGRLSGIHWIRLFGASGNTGILSHSATIPAETWTHVAGSCNGKTVQFFFNGVKVAFDTYASGALLQPTQLYVGGDNPDGSVADVDDLWLFDTPISPANVQRLYEIPRTVDTFDGGTDGAALTQSGITLSGTITYTSPFATHGSTGVVTPASTASNYWRRELGTNPTTHTTQFYFKVESSELTGTEESTLCRLAVNGSTTQIAHVKFDGNRHVTLNNADNTTIVRTSGTFEYGAGVRVVLKYDDANASSVRVSADVYLGANLEGSEPDETLTLPTFTPAGTFGRWMLGNVGSPTPSTASRRVAFDSWEYYAGIVDPGPFGVEAIQLNVQHAEQAQTSGNATLSLDTTMAPAAALQAQTSDNVTLVYNSGLTIADAAQVVISGGPTLEVSITLAPDGATQGTTSESPALVQDHVLVVGDALQAQSSGVVPFTQDHQLVVEGASQEMLVESPSVSEIRILQVDAATHALSSDTVVFPQVELIVQSATHAQTSTEIALNVPLTVADASHTQTAEVVNLTGEAALTVASASQTQVAQGVALTQNHQLTVAGAEQAQSVGAVPLMVEFTLVVQSGLHAQVADVVPFAQINNLVVQDAAQWIHSSRIYWDGVQEIALYWWDGSTKTPAVIRGMWDGENVIPVNISL